MRRVIVMILLVGVVTLAACSSDAEVLKLDVGTCFDDPESFEQVTEADIPIVPCGEPHDNEVFANQDLTGSEFPGTDQVANRADVICYDNFAAYVGISYEESVYVFSAFYPSADTWDAGDREVICFAYDADFAKITGSISGIGR